MVLSSAATAAWQATAVTPAMSEEEEVFKKAAAGG
jgi:hypothetical protein